MKGRESCCWTRYVPGVAGGVDGRVGNAAVEHLEPGLVLEHQGALDARWDRLAEADDGIVVDDGATREAEAKRQTGDGGSGEEQSADERLDDGRHLEINLGVEVMRNSCLVFLFECERLRFKQKMEVNQVLPAPGNRT